MPIYEFQCNKCGNTFEQLVLHSDREDDFICPSCGEGDICRLLSSFSCGSSDVAGELGSAPSSGCSPSRGFS